jgi:large subunit ribosomal protein L10
VNREQKVEEVKLIADRFEKAKALIFADYRGLKVSELTELRSKLRESGAQMKVVKNRLVKRVLKDRGLSDLDEFFIDPTALASADEDPVAPAKILVEFAKAHQALSVKAGFMDGALLTKAQIEHLATLPSREELLARGLASMNAPATNFVGVLAALPRQLVTVIDAIGKKKEETH